MREICEGGTDRTVLIGQGREKSDVRLEIGEVRSRKAGLWGKSSCFQIFVVLRLSIRD